MRIGHILHLSGMNRDTYNSLARRGHLSFMANRFGDDEDRSLTAAHALALVAFQTLRSIPVEVSAAHEAVSESWSDIVRTTGLSQEAPKSHLCGVRINDIGVRDTWGWPHPKSKGGKPIADASVDLVQLWKGLQPAIALLDKNDQSVDDGKQEA
ncbi:MULTISPECIES: hypothetical protein [unclassified Sphingomonas]|uniref:hypothetical protein n=1 Tax=unclassified Sphingomonas TaxID=196159 RepID=UPI0006FBDCE6|nr:MULTISPECIES: hypothetical protein [unclassified Sphingomonas]KQS48248.1 hypothetical protein ASG20_14175 [Sphingomonas sp. Leaf198]